MKHKDMIVIFNQRGLAHEEAGRNIRIAAGGRDENSNNAHVK